MASGILGQAALAATTNTTVYTVPAATLATVNISVVNTGSTQALFRLALAATGTPTTAEYIEYNVTLQPGSVLERNGIVLNTTKRVVAYSDAATVSVTVYGYEE
jgi:hypothetical protein